MNSEESVVYERLALLSIPFERHEHPPTATVDDARQYWARIDATHCKNLFLRNQKGNRHYLVILEHSKRADLPSVAAQIGDGKVSFASAARLATYLGVTPGSVSPLGLVHDREHHVRVYLDTDLRGVDRISFHPNVNTVTVTINLADFEVFLASCHNQVQYIRVA